MMKSKFCVFVRNFHEAIRSCTCPCPAHGARFALYKCSFCCVLQHGTVVMECSTVLDAMVTGDSLLPPGAVASFTRRLFSIWRHWGHSKLDSSIFQVSSAVHGSSVKRQFAFEARIEHHLWSFLFLCVVSFNEIPRHFVYLLWKILVLLKQFFDHFDHIVILLSVFLWKHHGSSALCTLYEIEWDFESSPSCLELVENAFIMESVRAFKFQIGFIIHAKRTIILLYTWNLCIVEHFKCRRSHPLHFNWHYFLALNTL
jgi:hypothetical protein